jgi:benzodiazapine receptor
MGIAAAWGVVVAAAGGLLTELSPWYYTLRNPAWKPPDWLFGPAWTIILALASYAAWLGWENAASPAQATLVCALFVLNGLLNMGWSLLFFKRRRPDLALIEVAFLWASILALVVVLAPISGRASLAMLPYLVWVSFASVLNAAIARANRPFLGVARP